MENALKLALAAAIVVSTYYAMLLIAEHKADALAGGHAYALDPRRAEEMIVWYERMREAVTDQLEGEQRRWFEWAVASALESALAAREEATGPASAARTGGEGGGVRETLQRSVVTPRGGRPASSWP